MRVALDRVVVESEHRALGPVPVRDHRAVVEDVRTGERAGREHRVGRGGHPARRETDPDTGVGQMAYSAEHGVGRHLRVPDERSVDIEQHEPRRGRGPGGVPPAGHEAVRSRDG